MAKVSVYNIEGKEVDTIELNDAVFGVEVNEHLVHMAVVNQLANNRQLNRISDICRSGGRSGRRSSFRQVIKSCPADDAGIIDVADIKFMVVFIEVYS